MFFEAWTGLVRVLARVTEILNTYKLLDIEFESSEAQPEAYRMLIPVSATELSMESHWIAVRPICQNSTYHDYLSSEVSIVNTNGYWLTSEMGMGHLLEPSPKKWSIRSHPC